MITEISPRIAFDPDFGRRHHSADAPATGPSPRGEHPDPVPSPTPGGAGPAEPEAASPPVRARLAAPATGSDTGTTTTGSSSTETTPLGRLAVLLTGYYRDRLAWLGLAVTTLMLCYLGGAAMFWVHAIYLDEPGPQIRPILHYTLDATAGLIGLTPPLLLVVPFAIWASRRPRARDDEGATGQWGVNPVRYALAGGSVFTLITVGGPFAHDTLVARGTWIARHVTELVGTGGAPTGPGTEIPLLESMLAQLVAGLPVYVVIMWASLYAVRHLTRLRHRRSQPRV